MILWLWTAVLSGFALFPLFAPRSNPLIPFGILAACVGLYTWFHPGLKRGSESDEDEENESMKLDGSHARRGS